MRVTKSRPDRTSRAPTLAALSLGCLLLLVVSGCAGKAATTEAQAPPVCYECFWSHQDPAFRAELVRVYETRDPADPLLAADVRYLLSRVRGDREGLCEAFRSFRRLRRSEDDPSRRLFLDETLAFTAGSCGGSPSRYFQRASRSARAAGEDWKAEVYQELANGWYRPRFGQAPLDYRVAAPERTEAYVIGESAIHVRAGCRVGVQMERTVRDWLSYQMSFDFSESAPEPARILTYHEGARLRDILAAADVTVVPLPGALVAKRGNRWFAPDEQGVFRFEVLPDKVQYPTTRSHGNLAYLVDTHGISTLVEPAIRQGAELVVGCGDYTGKVRAAYHLARRGIDVYFPCDRFVGELIGYDAPGTLIGSAPVSAEPGGAVIGNRPVTFRVDETVVVEDTTSSGELQYYDAPARYFRKLGGILPLKVEWVEIDGAGQSERVVRQALETGATAIAVRVWTEEDYRPVRDWLAASSEHRAVLFHTAAYAAGHRLFHEFPEQTTFGDPKPRFVSRHHDPQSSDR